MGRGGTLLHLDTRPFITLTWIGGNWHSFKRTKCTTSLFLRYSACWTSDSRLSTEEYSSQVHHWHEHTVDTGQHA